MLQTYSGTLSDGRIEWDTESPSGESVRVLVTVMDPSPEHAGRGAKMAAILDKLAESDMYTRFRDPVEWQREMREERTLPGREE